MSTHSQIVIAAPDRHQGAKLPSARVILSEWKGLGVPVYGLEDSVCVVILFISNLLTEEVIVVKARANCRKDIYYSTERLM